MAYTNTGGSLDQSGYQLGIFLVKAHYTVRGRRAIPLSASIRIWQMTPKVREEFKKALVEVERQLVLASK